MDDFLEQSEDVKKEKESCDVRGQSWTLEKCITKYMYFSSYEKLMNYKIAGVLSQSTSV